MKKLVTISALILSSSLTTLCEAQNWDSVSSGINGPVNTMAVYNGELYAGGHFTSAGGIGANNIAVWNGTVWDSVRSGIGVGFANFVYCFAVYNGTLYAGGIFRNAGGNPADYIAQWNGTSWSPVGSGIAVGNSAVYSLVVYNNKLIVGGRFTAAGGIPANNIASWDGAKWDTLAAGIRPNGIVLSMAAYDSILYVGGNFDSAGGQLANSIAQWNGTKWSIMGKGVSPFVSCMAIYKQQLYVGGNGIDSAGGNPVNLLASWNGSSWNNVPLTNKSNTSGIVYDLMVANGVLYVAGNITDVNGFKVNDIASFNASAWDSIGSGFTIDTGIYALAEYNSQLYAGGFIRASGTTPTNHVGRWMYPTGINTMIANTEKLNIYPNPSNGKFILQSIYNETEKGTIEFYNVLGEKVSSVKFSTLSTPLAINISSNPAGMYLYRILADTGNLICDGKLIIQK